MRKPASFFVGAVMVLMGSVFFLQGIGVLKGSGMSNTVTWSVLGPLIALAGGVLMIRGRRPRADR